jgi:hypothetical protein
MQDLDVSTRNRIDSLFQEARTKVNNAESMVGVKIAESAWNSLPEPKFEWDVSKSFAHALAGIYRDTGDFSKGISLMDAMFASGTVKPHQDGPRFVLGTLYFEKGDFENARKWLKEANKISKGRCFEGQPPRYKEFLNKP